MNTNGLNTFFGIAFLIALVGFAWVEWAHHNTTPEKEPVACAMDALLCPDGSAIGRVGPSCEFAPCPDITTDSTISTFHWNQIEAHKDTIIVTSPRPGDHITSPVTITGRARGNWFFEGSFPIEITGALGIEGVGLGSGIAEAGEDWMTENFVPFTAVVPFTPVANMSDEGSILLIKDNPSGLFESIDVLEIPIRF